MSNSINGYLWLWNRQSKLGKVFSSSTIFILPNGGKRSPDVAWIVNERWNALSLEEQEKFAPICPDFAIELRSRTDSLSQLQRKMTSDPAPLQGARMQEYLDSGLLLRLVNCSSESASRSLSSGSTDRNFVATS